MADHENNKENSLYFESLTMRGLFDQIQCWQKNNGKRLLSTSIEKDGDKFCCIALSNPSEVTLVDSLGKEVTINRDGSMDVYVANWPEVTINRDGSVDVYVANWPE